MADDIVERLRRDQAAWLDPSKGWWDSREAAECGEIADEIERLRAAGAALHALLDEMHRCGRRQPGLTEALEGWEAATKADADGR